MRLLFDGTYSLAPRHILRRSGYAKIINRDGVASYSLRLRKSSFPRFHVYIEISKKVILVNLHLDQKAPSYNDSHAHAGEYEGKLVEEEGERIKRWFEHCKL